MTKAEPKEVNELDVIYDYLYDEIKENYLHNDKWKKAKPLRLKHAIGFSYRDLFEQFWTLKAKMDDLQQYKDYVEGNLDCPSADECKEASFDNYEPIHNEGYD